MSPARFRWGAILIQIGILWLLRNFKVLGSDFWDDLLLYFPVLLIAIGIEKIFTKSRFQFISYLTTVFIFVAGFLVVYAGNVGQTGGFFSNWTYQLDPDPDVKVVKADINCENSDLTIRDSGSDLVYGEFEKYTRKPEISYAVQSDTGVVTMDSRRGSFLGGIVKIETGEQQNWYVRFSGDLPLVMVCRGKDSDIHLNMSTTPLENLDLQADNSSIYLKLGSLEPNVKVNIQGKDTNLRLRVPEDIGLKIFGEDYRSYLLRIGLKDAGDGTFVSDGYDTLQTKAEVSLDKKLGSVSVDYF
jgi:hypothetical protein